MTLRGVAQALHKATKRAEGNATAGSHGALWEVIPTMNYLFNMLKRSADEVTARPSLFTDHYQHCFNQVVQVLRTRLIHPATRQFLSVQDIS
jgi:hypothetical protein